MEAHSLRPFVACEVYNRARWYERCDATIQPGRRTKSYTWNVKGKETIPRDRREKPPEAIRFSENDLFLIQHSAWLINSVVVVGPLTPRNNGCKLLYVTSKHLRRKSFAARYDTDENVIPRTLAPESWYIRRISKRTIGGNRFECRINLIVSSRARFYSSLTSTWRISFFLRGILWDFTGKIFYTIL